MADNNMDKKWDLLDIIIKITMPFVVASLVAVTGILWSMNTEIAVLKNNQEHLMKQNPPTWVLDDIKEIKDDIKDIKTALKQP